MHMMANPKLNGMLHQLLEVCGEKLCSTHRIDSLDAHHPEYPLLVAGADVVFLWQNVGILKTDCFGTQTVHIVVNQTSDDVDDDYQLIQDGGH